MRRVESAERVPVGGEDRRPLCGAKRKNPALDSLHSEVVERPGTDETKIPAGNRGTPLWHKHHGRCAVTCQGSHMGENRCVQRSLGGNGKVERVAPVNVTGRLRRPQPSRPTRAAVSSPDVCAGGHVG